MRVSSDSRTQERELLAAARAGDEEAFRRLVEPHRSRIYSHCYRMLGSLHDAEDVLQESLLRAWRGLAGFDGRSAFRTWLYRITTNAGLQAISRRSRRALPIDDGFTGVYTSGALSAEVASDMAYRDDVLSIEEGYASPELQYEQREVVEVAFVAALQHLPPRQRAVLILREVLGFSAREVAEALRSTPASVNSALQRARKAVDERIPERSQQAAVRSLGDKHVREIVDRFTDAFERRDTAAILALLAENAALSMPAYAS
jgi:RNA polymerase sigma-70 factor (ECF subfamily)